MLAQRAETRRLEAQTRPTLYATGSVNGRAGGSPPNSGPLLGNGWAPIVPNYDVGVVLRVAVDRADVGPASGRVAPA